MHSYLMAAATTLLAILLMVIWCGLGMLRGTPFLVVLATTLLLLVAFFWIFHTGMNLRCTDASLTLPQMAAASITLLGAAGAADGGRAVFLVLLVMVCFFGALRLRTRTLLIHALCVVSGYIGVLGFLCRFRPEAINMQLELLNLLVFSMSMAWFASMAGHVSELREQRKTAFLTLARSERSLAETQRLAQFGSWTFDPNHREAMWSEETYRIFELDPKQHAVEGGDFCELVHAEDRQHCLHQIDKALIEGQALNAEYRVPLPSGSVRWVHAMARPFSRLTGESPVLQGMVMDITQRKTDEDQIRQLAHFDALTGLPNRNLLMHRLREAVAKARCGTPLALMFIDLDGFKAVNDSLGHQAGDGLLVAFAQRLGHLLRLSDTTARFGGDEFMVVIDDFKVWADIETVAKRILMAALTPFPISGHDCHVSASIGIAVYGPGCGDVDALIEAADTAMYAAKRGGKNGFRFHDSTLRS